MSTVTIGMAQRHIVVAGLKPSHVVAMKWFVLKNLYIFKLEKKDGRFVRVPDKPYAVANKDGTIWRFHRNNFALVKEFLDGLNVEVVVRDIPKPRAAKVQFYKNTDKEPYENQPKVIEYLIGEKPISKLVTMQTGKGKTFSTLYSLIKIGLRACVVVPKSFAGIWEEDIPDNIKINKSKRELMVISSQKELKNLIAYSATKEYEKNTKMLIIYTHCLDRYCKEFKDTYQNEEYGCAPWELFTKLGVGVKVVDEVHRNFHMNFILDLWLDCQYTINLSATMESSNEEQNKYYRMIFPIAERCPFIPYDKFIEVVDYRYYMRPGARINYRQRGMGTYSHVAFEQSVMRNKEYVRQWVSAIVDVARDEFFRIRDEGEKLLILCSTTAFSKLLVAELKKLYPKEEIGEYLQEDSYEKLSKLTIIVSTTGSAGTGVDIKGLRTNILTIAVGSRQSNEQILGRTRKFLKKGKDHRPRFVFMTCNDISQHRQYANEKHGFFKDKAFSIDIIESGNVLG